jgi:hypothetical protein
LSTPDSFPEICRSVCEARGWELHPVGVHVPLDGGRHQVVSLEVFDHEGSEMVRLSSTIGESSKLTPVRLTIALRINAELAHGAFAVKDDQLVMVETLLLADADPTEFESSIRYLAQTADYYERVIFETDDY